MNLLELLILLNLVFFGSGEVYTAITDLEELLTTETVLIDTLERYIQAQEGKLNLLRRYSFAYQNQHDRAGEDTQMYVANPINAYLLVKRLTTDWKEVENLMNANVGQEYVANLKHYKQHFKFPTDEDLNGAAVALTRLQDTYRLETSSLARGELNGVKYSSELNAADCFELGRQSYNNEDYYHTRLWMREADSRLGREQNETLKRSDVLEYLAFSTFKQGNMPLALDLTNKLLELIPTHTRALGNKAYYEDSMKKTNTLQRKGEDETEDISRVPIEPDYNSLLPSRSDYERLCRGDLTTPVKISSQLKCMYVHNNVPFLKIAPFKLEEAFLKPRVVVYHDVINDSEISTIKKMAQPRFRRATVQNAKTGEIEVAHYRISKSAWLKDYEHTHIQNLCKRVEDMTGLNQETSEELQVVNYGIGGHYEPHFDFARKEESHAFEALGTGNRIATVLFYMSDVAQGGATVFPDITVALWPKKGNAAFWYNLHPSGEGDKNTRHAACPVLAGSKWVSNKWIHERGQEFRRPCDLHPADPNETA